MKYDVWQIIGAAAVVTFGQATIRLLIDHDNAGFLGGLHGGFAATLSGYAAGTVIGVLLTGWAHTRAKALGRRG
ncbi:hypothetical protein [Streptomyces pinistramenti]|uniref:hypothetical protein n=1 Tax=Streptomyces pinistramenti TaxID=2884812 RepID=UPI001D06CE66|nr:hypothetical protein [Streptomyces pinistramenti]MCB5910208.1 hypothetical protein [Streptomyces pinistramenti]